MSEDQESKETEDKGKMETAMPATSHLLDEHPFSPQNLSKAIEIVVQIKERREAAASPPIAIKKDDVDKFV